RTIGTSLPGSGLYGVKRLGENLQGALLMAAGEQTAWHAQQAEARLREWVLVTQKGDAVDPALAATIEATIADQVQAMLTASTGLSAGERTQFLTDWLDTLQTVAENVSAPSPATLTLNKTVATVEAALIGITFVLPTPPAPAAATSNPANPASMNLTPTPDLALRPEDAQASGPPLATALPLPPTDVTTVQLAPTVPVLITNVPVAPLVVATNAADPPFVFDASQASGVITLQMPQETPDKTDDPVVAASDEQEDQDNNQADDRKRVTRLPSAPTPSFGAEPATPLAPTAAATQASGGDTVVETTSITDTGEAATAAEPQTPPLTDPTEATADQTTPVLTDSPVASTATPQPTRTPQPVHTDDPRVSGDSEPTSTPNAPVATPTDPLPPRPAPTDTPTAGRPPSKELEKTAIPTDSPKPTATEKATEAPEPTEEEEEATPIATAASSASTPTSVKRPSSKTPTP
ncbi:MAG: DUF5667 domain-containing protein, partial [Chloroflexota bacterium]|nr:DUF5667 domain-containing protein [Chloroflexota bacterium]